jgi:hypothetical protein
MSHPTSLTVRCTFRIAGAECRKIFGRNPQPSAHNVTMLLQFLQWQHTNTSKGAERRKNCRKII